MYNPQITYTRIQEIANLKGISMAEINEKCELSKNTISQSANSQEGMKAKKLFDISTLLSCSVDYLLGRTDEPKIETANPTTQILVERFSNLSPEDKINVLNIVLEKSKETVQRKSIEQKTYPIPTAARSEIDEKPKTELMEQSIIDLLENADPKTSI